MTIDRQWSVALGGSLALHLIGVIAAILLIWRGLMAISIPSPADEQPIPDEREITMLIPEKIIVEPAKPKDRAIVESDQRNAPDKAPENSEFESNANATAASAMDPTDAEKTKGAQDGRHTPTVELDQKMAKPDIKEPVDEVVTPPEVSPDRPKMIGDNPDEAVTPPEALQEKPLTEKEKSEAELMKVRSAVDGGAEKTGSKAAVDAEETPRGKYKLEVKAAIGRQWNAVIDKRGPPAPGVLKLSMIVSPDGSISDIKWIDDSGDARMKDTALTALIDASVPQMPEEVEKTLEGRPFLVEYEFVSYPSAGASVPRKVQD